MYFQNYGLWYRETGGVNSIVDISTGNNPHVGPYDNGYKYINQLSSLIPNFSAVTITSETANVISYDLFTNYNSGEITNYNGDTYVDVTTVDGTDLPKCFVVNTSIELDPIPKTIISSCGCPSTDEDDMLSICLEKGKGGVAPLDCPAWIKPPEPNESGYYVFDLLQYNQDGSVYLNPSMNIPTVNTTFFVGTDCCGTLQGRPMYTEFGTIYGGNLQTVQSGYICCAPGQSRCGCMASCNWVIKNNTYDIDGESYLDFTTLYGLGASTLVTSDGTNCPSDWTSPVNITDPYTGLNGFGCKLNFPLIGNYTTLVSMFQDKAYNAEGSGRCCSWDFSPTTSTNAISFRLYNSFSQPFITSIKINGFTPSSVNAASYEFPLSNGGYQASPPTINGTSAIPFTNNTSIYLTFSNYTTGQNAGTVYFFNVSVNNVTVATLGVVHGAPDYTINLSGINPGDNISINFGGN
jgi:hypothetical protein